MSWREGKTTSERGYNSRWNKARVAYLNAHPLCVYCQQQGRVTSATVVDHIVPHKGDSKLFWDSNNWQALCKHCHDSVKQREEQGKTIGHDINGYPLSPNHHWNTGGGSKV